MDRKRKRTQSLDVNEMQANTERRAQVQAIAEQRQLQHKRERQVDKFLTRKSDALKHELSEMRTQAGRKIEAHEADLAGYMLRRAADGRHLRKSEVEKLSKGHQTVVETRQKLNRGRGNVSKDIADSNHQSTRFMKAGRDLDTALQEIGVNARVSGASTAEFVRAGNCQEHADVSTHGHAKRLTANQSIHTRSLKSPGDHVWSEVRNKDNKARTNDVIVDAWAYGPAVLREDSYFAKRPSGSTTQYNYTKREALKANKAVANLNKDLASNKSASEFVSKRMDKLNKDNYKSSGNFLPTSVLDKGFMTRTDNRLSKPVDLQGKLSKTQLQRVGGKDTKVDLRNEILATGVARQLGSNVRQATQHAPQIVNAAKNLPQNKN